MLRRSGQWMAAFALVAVAASPVAHAGRSPALDRVSVWLGGYYAANDTSLDVRGAGAYAGVEGNLDFEDDLGLREHGMDPRLRLDFLLGDSQGFSFDYYRIHRSRDASYDEPIPALGTDAGASIHAAFDHEFGSASYKWWFGHGDDVFGVGLGAAYYSVDFRANGNGHAGNERASEIDSYSESAWAPMLTLGWHHAFNEDWRLYADVSGVKKNGGPLSGHVWNAALGVEWFPWRHLGFALEYATSRLHLEKRYDEGTAKLDLNSDGPALYLRARF